MTMAQKQMKRTADKRLAEHKKSKKQIERFMKEGQMDTAKIHAENAIRQYSEFTQYLQLAARIDAVAQRVKTAITMGQMNKNMHKVVSGMSKGLKAMDVEKLTKVMEQFEEDNETLDVRTAYMDGAIANTVSGATPQSNVTELMQQIGDEIGLDVSGQLEDGPVPTSAPIKESTAAGAVKEV
eukprot:CAMPEP_0204825566 /NCGR_PEP_ID=MMETSP1346-20131115/3431_1 /ASSEMBLY_ACC=CAM_ASM_000771 /TAXON_ID=215587 /ORGANISM="Aplanochytrium stocchinoi, Strain GSBS06" /LENGTH=181 /DNA_ID=CAMNT_0051953237 /DNA_START=395 /DNA_END=940 /DNA_ORIENTATION=+